MKSFLFAILLGFSFTSLAQELKLDLRERIQFSKNETGEVTFEFCKKNKCDKLNAKPISQARISEASRKPDVPPGIAQQILADAGVNSETHPTDYAVSGMIIGNSEKSGAVCLNSELREKLKNAKKESDFLFHYSNDCNSVSPIESVRIESELLKRRLQMF